MTALGALTRKMVAAPWRWGVIYLLLVPLFATAYYSLPPRSLYDSNMERETAMIADAERLRQALTSAVRSRIQDTRWHSSSVDLQVALDSVRIGTIKRTSDGRLFLEIRGQYAQSDDGPPHEQGVFSEYVEVQLVDGRRAEFPRDSSPIFGYAVRLSSSNGDSVEPSPYAPPVSQLLPTSSPGTPALASLMMPESTDKQLAHFYNAVGGDPSVASGLWWRMAYFSATTITTLGFGDITPVSSRARFYIGLEAVMGIVLIGLFLNSVSSNARRKAVAPLNP